MWSRIQHLCYISVETTPSVAAWNGLWLTCRAHWSPVPVWEDCGPFAHLRPPAPHPTHTHPTAPLSPKSVHAHTLRPLTQLKHCGGGPEVSQEVSCEGSVSELGDGCCCVSAHCWPPGFQRGTNALWEDFDQIRAKQNNTVACGIISHSLMWERSTTKDLIQHVFSVPTVDVDSACRLIETWATPNYLSVDHPPQSCLFSVFLVFETMAENQWSGSSYQLHLKPNGTVWQPPTSCLKAYCKEKTHTHKGLLTCAIYFYSAH